jgi:hypothetical protein
MAGPFDNLTSAFDGSDPASYQQLLLRQRIADTMLKQGQRKGYPKNLGEGLTAIGDSLGEIGMMRQMMAAQKAIEGRRPAAAPLPGPQASADAPAVRTADAGYTPPSWLTGAQYPASPPQATADASPFPDVASPIATAAATLTGGDDGGASQSLPPAPVADASPSAVPTRLASLADGSTMSDADPLPATMPQPPAEVAQAPPSNLPQDPAVRDRMAATLNARQGGPQPNPMLGGQSPAAMPSTFNPEDLGSPLNLNNRPIVLPGVQQLAENGPGQPFQVTQPRQRPPASAIGPDTPNSPQTSAPLPNQAPGVYDKPIPPDLPKRTQEDPEHAALIKEIIRRKQIGEDPVIVSGLEAAAGEWEKRRAYKDTEKQRQYQSDLAQYNQKMENYLTANQGLPMAKEKLTQERYATDQKARQDQLEAAYGNLPAHVHTFLNESKGKAQTAVTSLEGIRNAREVIDAGTLFGAEAPAKLLWYKAKAATGDANAARIVAATETYRTALGPVAAAAIKTYGGNQISNEDRREGFMMAGADYSLNEKSARRMLDIAERSATAALGEHRDNIDTMLKGQMGEERLRRMYDVPNVMPGIPLPGGGAPRFATEEEAKASGLPNDTPILINGRRAKIRR